MNADPLLLGVLGRPVLHSWSPALFHRALASVGRRGRYLRLRAESAAEGLDLARCLGLCGLSVTAPYKESVLPLLDRLDPSAARVGAANAVRFEGARSVGTNTDVAGVYRMLAQRCGALRGARVALLGAGGAARAAGHVLAGQGCREVLLVNRDPIRGGRTARDLGLRYVPWERAGAEMTGVDLAIACLAPGAVVPPGWLISIPLVLDASYHRAVLPSAAGLGGVLRAGATWLVGQAAASFSLMTDSEAPDAAFELGLADAREQPLPRPGALVLVGPGAVGRALADRVPMPVRAVQAEDLADDDLARVGLVVLCVAPDAPLAEPVRRLLERPGRSADLVLFAGRDPDTLAATIAGELAALDPRAQPVS